MPFPSASPASPGEDATEPPHTHRWHIEEQHAPQSRGTCDCGAERLFTNGWDDQRDGWGTWGGRKPTPVS